MDEFGEFHSTMSGNIGEEEGSIGANKKMLTELGILASLIVLFFIVLTPWALPRIRYSMNNDFYKVIPDEDYGFCTDGDSGLDVFRANKCVANRCTETFYTEEGATLKAYNYDDGKSPGSEERFSDCINTNYYFFEKQAPGGL